MNVAALVPTYNRRTQVIRAIDSILSQEHPVDEVIVIDDGSTDGSAQSIRSRYGKRVRVVSQDNTGVSGARRRAVREAQCEWIAFLDSDDEWLPDRTGRLLEAAALVPANVAWIFGDALIIKDGSEPISLFERHGLKMAGNMQVFSDIWSVHHPFQFGLVQTSIIRRAALLAVDCFSEGLRHSEDFLVGVQVACQYRFAAVSATVTKIYRTSDLLASSSDLAGRYSEDYFRARVDAYSLIARNDARKQWPRSHAHGVRGLCRALARKGEPVSTLALQQFRFGFSLKSVAFFVAALFGHVGVEVWIWLGSRLRSRRDVDERRYAL